MIELPWLDAGDDFPPSEFALTYPNGLLAAGGDLSTERLLRAYSRGIFPWYSDGEPILWWSPDPRCVVFPSQAHCSRSLAKLIRKGVFTVTLNSDFQSVITLCGETRKHDQGTWITDELLEAYIHLAKLGYAHSVEVWQDERLVGGLYGVAMNQVFFGESMFSLVSNASKVAFITLANLLTELNFKLIDCQVRSEHLISLGAIEIGRDEFERIIDVPRAVLEHPKPVALAF